MKEALFSTIDKALTPLGVFIENIEVHDETDSPAGFYMRFSAKALIQDNDHNDRVVVTAKIQRTLDWSKPIQTRNGCKAILYKIDGGGDHPIHLGIWSTHRNHWMVCTRRADGTHRQDNEQTPFDVINVPETIEVPLVVTREGGVFDAADNPDDVIHRFTVKINGDKVTYGT